MEIFVLHVYSSVFVEVVCQKLNSSVPKIVNLIQSNTYVNIFNCVYYAVSIVIFSVIT